MGRGEREILGQDKGTPEKNMRCYPDHAGAVMLKAQPEGAKLRRQRRASRRAGVEFTAYSLVGNRKPSLPNKDQARRPSRTAYALIAPLNPDRYGDAEQLSKRVSINCSGSAKPLLEIKGERKSSDLRTSS